MKLRTPVRLLLAAAIYFALTVIACLIFMKVRLGWNGAAPSYAALFGPALSLFTHESYFLFATVSAMVFPWLAVGMTKPTFIRPAAAIFVFSWLGTGWWLHRLF
jgi:hypothetical protein